MVVLKESAAAAAADRNYSGGQWRGRWAFMAGTGAGVAFLAASVVRLVAAVFPCPSAPFLACLVASVPPSGVVCVVFPHSPNPYGVFLSASVSFCSVVRCVCFSASVFFVGFFVSFCSSVWCVWWFWGRRFFVWRIIFCSC